MPPRLVTAAHRYVIASGVPAALVADGLLGADPVGGPFPQWLFSGDLTGNPYRSVEGTGKCAVVLYTYDDWSAFTSMHTLRFPRLSVGIYADCSRDSAGNFTAHDAEAKIEQVFLRLNPLFHDAANRVRKFADLTVVSTVMGSPLSVMEIPDGDGAVRGTVGYDITLP